MSCFGSCRWPGRLARRSAVGILCLVGVLACLLPPPVRARMERTELVVSAASSLGNVVRELGAQFARNRPGVKVVHNLAATGVLLQQILHGAPADLFIAANRSYMVAAKRQGVVRPATIRLLAANTLVLAAPKGEGENTVSRLEDLVRPEVRRIGVGNPATVPAGQYAQQVLQRHRLWRPLAGRLIFGGSARQVLDYLRRGEVDAGFVYRTDVRLFASQIRVAAETPDHDPIVYPAAITTTCRQPELARRFLAFARSAAGQKVWRRFGFLPPPED